MFTRSDLKKFLYLAHSTELFVSLQRRKLLILCYHSVVSSPRSPRWGYEDCAGQSEFRAQMQWLQKQFTPIDLSGLERWQQGAWTGSKGPVLITFDDGYRNNLTLAAPILKEEGCPAVFFLSTGYIGTNRLLWNDEVRLQVMHWPEQTIRLPNGETVSVSAGVAGRRELARAINQTCKRLPDDDRLAYLQYLNSKAQAETIIDDAEARAFMDWNEARTLARMGFEIGSHTVEHAILSSITDRTRLAAELRHSKQTLERELQRPCLALAYPNGTVNDVNAAVFEEVRAAGFRWAFMTTPVWQTRGGDPYQLARISVPGHTDMATFALYASGLHSYLFQRSG